MDKQNDSLNNCNIQVLTLILSENQSHKCLNLLKKQNIRDGVVVIGKGTVSSTVLNLFGITSQRRDIIKILLKKEKAEEAMNYFDEMLQLSKPGHGIAFTSPVISAVGLHEYETNHCRTITNTVHFMEEKSMFKKLSVIVDRGMSDDVMEIARKAGVRGGTILHGRGANTEIATNLFGVEIEPEKELVIILMPDDLVDKVVNALCEELHLDEPGKGILFVEPVIDTRGLFEMRDKNNK